MTTTYILNFGHALHKRVIAHLAPAREIRVSFSLDMGKPTGDQVAGIVDKAAAEVKRLGGALDGTAPVVVALPGLAEGAALLLAELHGRTGGFPRVLALRRQGDGTYGLFADSAGLGVLDLDRVRNEARGRR